MPDLHLITYEDASYLYKNVFKPGQEVHTPPPTQSIGYINEQTDTYIDVCLAWKSKPEHEFEKGVVIPLKAVLSLEKVTP